MKINFKKFLTASLLAVLVFACNYSIAMAVALQPAGEFPKTEPLRPVPVGVEPNYSNNVQDDVSTPANSVSGQNFSEEQPLDDSVEDKEAPATEPVNQNESVPASSNKWFALVVILVIGVIGGAIYWFRKSTRTEAALVLAGLAIVGVSILTPFGIAKSADAQGTSRPEPPIQRTIEVENSDGQTPSQITTKDQANTTSQKQVVFGLAAVLLVVVAVVAVAVLWQNKN